MRVLLSLTLCLALAPAEDGRGLKPLTITAADGSEVARITSHHALIIGNSAYGNGWQPLPGVRDDVAAVRGAFERQGFDVEVASDLSRSQMDERISHFVAAKGQDPNGRVVLYYAGHGQTLKNPQGQEIGYLVPVDAPVPTDAERAHFIEKAYPIQRIKIAAQELGCRHGLFIFDACFSGSLFAPLRGGNRYLLQLAAEPVRMFITSGSSDESVPDTSVFREELVNALDTGAADANGDGWTTGSELSLYLRQQVMGRRAAAGGKQTPQAGISEQSGLNRGDVVFQRGIAAAPAPPPPPATAPPVVTAPVPTPQAAAPAGAPAWASATGSDAGGRWADFTAGGETVRMRLIPAAADAPAFWLAESECTQGLWNAVIGSNPSNWQGGTRFNELLKGVSDKPGWSDLPVEQVSWDEVHAFCDRLRGMVRGLEPRLPSEAEWLRACGTPPSDISAVAWTRDSPARYPSPVANRPGNAFGVRDMLGNLWEWCEDPYVDTGPATGAKAWFSLEGAKKDEPPQRVIRGGGFLDKAEKVAALPRMGEPTGYRSRDIGFRLAVSP